VLLLIPAVVVDVAAVLAVDADVVVPVVVTDELVVVADFVVDVVAVGLLTVTHTIFLHQNIALYSSLFHHIGSITKKEQS